jgi:hypothetical protein
MAAERTSWWIAIAAVLVAAGCGELKSGVRADEQLSGDSSYVYGRFFIATPPSGLGLAGHESVGLVLRCDEHQEYKVWFSAKRDVQVVKINPAHCAVDQVVFTDVDGRELYRIHPRRPASDGHDFWPKVAYYLGDFQASLAIESQFNPLRHRTTWTFKIVPVHQQYDVTTAEMRRAFPGLASMRTENSELIAESASERAQTALTDDARRPHE